MPPWNPLVFGYQHYHRRRSHVTTMQRKGRQAHSPPLNSTHQVQLWTIYYSRTHAAAARDGFEKRSSSRRRSFSKTKETSYRDRWTTTQTPVAFATQIIIRNLLNKVSISRVRASPVRQFVDCWVPTEIYIFEILEESIPERTESTQSGKDAKGYGLEWLGLGCIYLGNARFIQFIVVCA